MLLLWQLPEIDGQLLCPVVLDSLIRYFFFQRKNIAVITGGDFSPFF